MPEYKKYKFTVWTKDGHCIHPVIEAANMGEATRIAKAQYSDAKTVAFAGEVR